ncbi:MAG: DUF2993 domain-containing protein [Actinomycetota bacterium]|nr:DUF2993 domain-containing protein [Actinomycetota bacterium]
MRKLVFLVVVVGLALALDQGARLFAEGKLADRAREAAVDAADAEASITSFPFLGRLLVSGAVPRVEVRVERAVAGPLRLAAVAVDARGVSLDRGRLLSGDVRVEDIEEGTVSVEVDASSLSEALDVPITVTGGQVRAQVRGVGVAARPEVSDDGSLVLRVAGLPALNVPLERIPLVPCAATAVEILDDRVRLTCQVDELPAPLRR